jgi:hypothetical protein
MCIALVRNAVIAHTNPPSSQVQATVLYRIQMVFSIPPSTVDARASVRARVRQKLTPDGEVLRHAQGSGPP